MAGVYLILSSLNDNIVFFYPPSKIDKIKAISSRKIRVGGLVKTGSVKQINQDITFVITDYISDIRVKYRGILPALFRQEQGIVAEGVLMPSGVFQAHRLLVKHDENYAPSSLEEVSKNRTER
jgi:cytochrome c-type biogenesis protein CcmE